MALSKLLINQRIITWRDKYDVYDEGKKRKYTVKGDLVTLVHHLHVLNEKGKEIGSVKERLSNYG